MYSIILWLVSKKVWWERVFRVYKKLQGLILGFIWK